jgi:hypothetical protein
MPSHQTSPSSVRATLVKIELALRRSPSRWGWCRSGARRDAEVAGLGVDRVELAVGAGLDPGDVVADVVTSQPSSAKGLGGISMAKLVLPQAEGKAAAT